MPLPAPRRRADARRTRDHLLRVLGQLVQQRGIDITMPELAKAADVATSTVYRHFDEINDLRREYYAQVVGALLDEWDHLCDDLTGRELFDAANLTWVRHLAVWARPARFLRSPEGFLTRARDDDPLLRRHRDLIIRILSSLAADGGIPAQNYEYATLVWVSMFDERVYTDLADTQAWDDHQIATILGNTTIAALSVPAP